LAAEKTIKIYLRGKGFSSNELSIFEIIQEQWSANEELCIVGELTIAALARVLEDDSNFSIAIAFTN
jgi:hypothetical protein